MKKKWQIFEKTAGISHITIGIFILYFVGTVFIMNFGTTGTLDLQDAHTFKLIKDLHLLAIMAVTGIAGGVLLLLRRRAGWILSVATYFAYFLVITLNLFQRNTYPAISENLLYYIIFGTITLTLLPMAVFLISRVFREKYSYDRPALALICCITGIMVLDKLIIG